MYRRYGRNSDIILTSVYHYGHTTVLWLSFLGNIHTAHDLDTGGNGRKKAVVIDHLLIEGTVNTVTYTYFALKSLYMNITGSLSHCLLDQGTYQLHDRCVADICHCSFLIVATKKFTLSGKPAGCIHIFGGTITVVNGSQYFTGGGNIRFYLEIGDDGNIIDGCHIHRICHGKMKDIGIVWIQFKGDTLIFLKNINIDQLADIFRNGDPGQMNQLHPQLCLERPGNHVFGDHSVVYQNFTDLLSGALLELQCFFQFFFCENLLLDKKVSKSHSFLS